MTEEIVKEILEIKASGVPMVNIRVVERLAKERHYTDLANYIRNHPDRYFRYILYGNEDSPSAIR